MQAVALERSPLTICVEQLQQAAGPAASHENIVALSAKLLTDSSTLQACARIILRDLGLTLRLLRIANSVMFNHIGSTVMSVTHAAALMGTDALSQMVDSVPRHALPRPARELVALSHLTAVIARTLVSRVEPRYGEEAFVSGLFRNIGEVCYVLECPAEYQKLLFGSQGQMIGLRAACRSQNRFEFDELTAGLLQNWSLHGAPVLSAQSTPDALFAQHGNQDADIALAASVAHVIVTANFRCDIQERDKVMRYCLPVLAKAYRMRDAQVPELCFGALESVYGLMQQLNLSRDRLRLREWIPETKPEQKAPAPVSTVLPKGATMATLLDTAITYGVDRAAWLPYAEPVVKVSRLAGQGWPGNAVEALPGLLHPRKPPFLLAFGQRQDVWIDFAKDDRFASSDLAKMLRPEAFFLLPVSDGKRVRGCLYFDWTRRRDFAAESLVPPLSALRDYVATSMPAA
ncbi:MAG TPA: HDOD domain-containing protein [Bryobacteraceae bacterium]|nr:HDOD domain-containing protein [Bryobacteraceae bacterium]